MPKPLTESFRNYYSNHENSDKSIHNKAALDLWDSLYEWAKSNESIHGREDNEDRFHEICSEWFQKIAESFESERSAGLYNETLTPSEENNKRLYSYLTAMLREVKRETGLNPVFSEKKKLWLVVNKILKQMNSEGKLTARKHGGVTYHQMPSSTNDLLPFEKNLIREFSFPFYILIKGDKNADHTLIESFILQIISQTENYMFDASVLTEIISQNSDLALSEETVKHRSEEDAGDDDNDSLFNIPDSDSDSDPEKTAARNETGIRYFSRLKSLFNGDEAKCRNAAAGVFYYLVWQLTFEEIGELLEPPRKKSSVEILIKSAIRSVVNSDIDLYSQDEITSGLQELCMIIGKEYNFSEPRSQ